MSFFGGGVHTEECLFFFSGTPGYKACSCANGWDDLISIIYVFNSFRTCSFQYCLLHTSPSLGMEMQSKKWHILIFIPRH